MKKELKNYYEEQMFRIFQEMEKVDVNSDDYKNLTEQLNELYKSINQDETLDLEVRKAADDASIRLKENKVSAWKDNLKTAVEFLGVVVPSVIYVSYLNKSMKFEETGVFTSNTVKGFLSKLKPGK